MDLKQYIKEELKQLEKDQNYYGSKEQIESENFIVRQSFKDFGIEMKYKECLEEFYFRILQIK